MSDLIWSTVKRRVNDLLPQEINPRKITEEKRSVLIASLEKFNLAEIPVINLDNSIITGHQRLNALQILERGEEEIDVRLPNRMLTKAETKEYMIIGNSHAGDWDWELLDLHYAEIDNSVIPVDFNDVKVMEAALVEKKAKDAMKK